MQEKSNRRGISTLHWLLILGVIIAIIVLITTFRGSETDSATADQLSQTTAELSEKATALEQQLQSCTAALSQASAAVQNGTDAVAKAVNAVSAKLEACEENLDLTNEDVDEKDEQIDELETTLADTARRLCCIQRVYDSSIDSYTITNNTIVCEANGDEAISC